MKSLPQFQSRLHKFVHVFFYSQASTDFAYPVNLPPSSLKPVQLYHLSDVLTFKPVTEVYQHRRGERSYMASSSYPF